MGSRPPIVDDNGRRVVPFLTRDRMLGIANELDRIASSLGASLDAGLRDGTGGSCRSFADLVARLPDLVDTSTPRGRAEAVVFGRYAAMVDSNVAAVVESLSDLRPAENATDLLRNLAAYVLTWLVVVGEWRREELTEEQRCDEDLVTVTIKLGLGILERAAIRCAQHDEILPLLEIADMLPYAGHVN
jgi:hypothetical protein